MKEIRSNKIKAVLLEIMMNEEEVGRVNERGEVVRKVRETYDREIYRGAIRLREKLVKGISLVVSGEGGEERVERLSEYRAVEGDQVKQEGYFGEEVIEVGEEEVKAVQRLYRERETIPIMSSEDFKVFCETFDIK